MRLLHFADLHLEHSYAAERIPTPAGRHLRAELRATLERVLALAVNEQIDCITIAGGLYEHGHATADTARFLRATFERCPVRVLIAPGREDPFLAGSVYQLTPWPKTVTIAGHADLRPYRVDSSTVWAAGQLAEAGPDRALAPLPEGRDGVQVALLPNALALEDADVEALGFAHLLSSGTTPVASPRRTVPETLASFGFAGAGKALAAALIQFDGAAVTTEVREVSPGRLAQRELDLTDLSDAEVTHTLAGWVSTLNTPTVARVTLTGHRPIGWRLDAEKLGHGLSVNGRTVLVVDGTRVHPPSAEEPMGPTVLNEIRQRLAAEPAGESRRGVRELALDLALRALGS